MVEKIPVKPVEEFNPAGVAELDLYQKREKIYTRRIEGFYQRIRIFTGWPLLLGYFFIPWINWHGQQAVLFDLPSRKFYIFAITFWPQDFYLLAAVLIIAAFSLFAVTAWVGRVWCGYTCPQTIWTAIFMWAEQFCEGSRNQRIKRDKGPWNSSKVWRKAAKHTLWIGFAFLTGLTFIGYFSPIRELSANLLSSFLGVWQLGLWEAAWIIFFTSATYINAGWLREQVCIYMCPYARFQSVMFDKDTLIVSYDVKRGEKRGARKKASDYRSEGLGDCVDCKICVQVCPTGIDIRNGLQYECINCALCIDGCNSVMEQMGYDTGLIRYTTESALNGQPVHFLRPRLIGYGVTVLLMISIFAVQLYNRIPLELDVDRDREHLYLETYEGLIENNYTLKVINMDQRPHQYTITVEGLPNVMIVGSNTIQVDKGEVKELLIRLQLDPANLKAVHNVIRFTVLAQDNHEIYSETESRFIGPRI